MPRIPATFERPAVPASVFTVGAPLPGRRWPPSGAARLKAPLPCPYRSPWLRWGVRAADFGAKLWRPRRNFQAVDWPGARRVAVLRLDHLGDLVLLLPFLRRLRAALPKAKLDLWVGPWGADLAKLFADVDAVRVAPASWFGRPRGAALPWGELAALARELKAESYDAAFEPRGDPRHLWALWKAGIPVRAAQVVGGGGFWATHPARWVEGLHEQDQSLSLADQAGVPPGRARRGSVLALPPEARREAGALARELGLRGRVVMVQAACGSLARRWPPEAWAAFLDGLGPSATVCLLGSPQEEGEMRSLASRLRRPPRLAVGRLSLAGLAAFLLRARLLVSVNSGPAHLAAAQGVPVLSLFSGADRPGRWAPRGARVTVLRAPEPACSPCELPVCPYGNACMAALSPDAVLAHARRLLGLP